MEVNFNSIPANLQSNSSSPLKGQVSVPNELFKLGDSDFRSEIMIHPPKNFEEMKKIFADKFALYEDEITKKTHLVKDLKFDDLDYIRLWMFMEQICQCNIEDEEVNTLKTVGDLMNLYLEKTKKN